jgi:hypothetical protein
VLAALLEAALPMADAAQLAAAPAKVNHAGSTSLTVLPRDIYDRTN